MIAEAECADDCYRIDRFGSDKAHLGPEGIYKAMLAASPAPVVTEEMVERAARAYCASGGPCGYTKCPEDGITCGGKFSSDELSRMRAALSAALEVKVERG
jgi:hypothetical protein